MSVSVSTSARVSRSTFVARRPLAASIAGLFALAAPAAALADTWIVDSCDEGSHATAGVNHGTLRYALANATSPATLDLTFLTGCSASKISLSTGQLATTIDTLTINGPGANLLTLDASGLPPLYGDSRVLAHTGAGKLTVTNLALSGGHVTHSGYSTSGGCLFSNGDIELDGVAVSGCYALNFGTTYKAKGGGVYAHGALTLNASSVSSSHAASGQTSALGGGVYAGGKLTLGSASSLHDNSVSATGQSAFGGGAYAKTDAALTSATIASNDATSTDANAHGGGLYVLGDLTMSLVTVDSNHTATTNGGSRGGGLYVKGSAKASDSIIGNNSVVSQAFYSGGGGAYVRGAFTLDRVSVLKNVADIKNQDFVTSGGGLGVAGDLTATYSEIDGNSATATAAVAGGIFCGGNVTLTGSSVSGNNSGRELAGLVALSQAPDDTTLTIANSTLSGNIATQGGGGLYTNAGIVSIVNSTVAFNKAGAGDFLGVHIAPGVALKVMSKSPLITFESSIIANNSYGAGIADDVSMSLAPVAIGGGSNVIWHVVDSATAAKLPANPVVGCPLLGPLRDNGGPTRTHALLSGSPGIDAGTNILSLAFDQRGGDGTFDYVRESGPAGILNPRSDVGAYEVQQDEIIFNSGFDGCLAF